MTVNRASRNRAQPGNFELASAPMLAPTRWRSAQVAYSLASPKLGRLWAIPQHSIL